jgi:hypothetical protein
MKPALLMAIALAFAINPIYARKVEDQVPSDLRFAAAFIQRLDKSGLEVEKVAHSKFNGGVLV